MTGQDLSYTAAEVAAGRNWEANLRVLAGRQADLAAEVARVEVRVEWVLGRDGALTARDNGAWVSDCSLPLRTAGKLLEKMTLKAPVVCFLAPTHAAQVRVTLDRLGREQALIAVVPEVHGLRLMLGCDRFEDEIGRGRLWFAWGENWERELERVLREQDGLPLPGQFVRTALVEGEQLDGMIRGAQGVFGREAERRADLVRSLLSSQTVIDAGRVCVVAGGMFRLWDDVGSLLQKIGLEGGWDVVNLDDACAASPVALARGAAGCGTVVVANMGRAELPVILPPETKVITWLTTPLIPACVEDGAGDRLMVADERWRRAAIAAGWPGERVSVVAWPAGRPAAVGEGLGVIADTVAISMPEFALSSLGVLWESILRELSGDPFAVGVDAEAYLARWRADVGIVHEVIDRGLFIERLILPAYAQGLARWLLASGVKLRLYGKGWSEIEEFAAWSAGEIAGREELARAVETCAALVHVWPGSGAHPIEAVGRPVLRRSSKGREMWLNEAKRLARGEGKLGGDGGVELSAEVIRLAAGLA